jgi:putative DNA methylase
MRSPHDDQEAAVIDQRPPLAASLAAARRACVGADLADVTMLERAFPYVEVSRLVAADRRSRDSAYQAHRWWARRPPSLVRAVLVAAALPASATPRTFRDAYASEEPLLGGWKVSDAFAGGGTTLVEAARLGAVSAGGDVDPLAVLLNRHQLDPADGAGVAEAAAALTAHLRTELAQLWPAPDGDGPWQPLHYFAVAVVDCPGCGHHGPLYRSHVLARSGGKAGSVTRDQPVVAFCPDCLKPRTVAAGTKTLRCCGRRRALDAGTYSDGRYRCPACSKASDHVRLRTGAAPRAVVAVEDTPAKGDRKARRRIREPQPQDLAGEAAAVQWLAQRTGKPLPLDRPLVAAAGDDRPVSYGITTVGMLHTARQAAYLAAAHDWVDAARLAPGTARALRLAVSSTVLSNNRLCGYATDYGRLAPLFSVRAFSLPALAVELNPLNPDGGRGTLAAAVARVIKSADTAVRRHVLDNDGTPRPRTLDLPRVRPGHTVRHADSAAAADGTAAPADVCVTDPPYYDFIPYDALSQVFRAWLPEQDLAGDALLPDRDDGVEQFGRRLGTALRAAADGLKPGALIAFTYKGGEDAWDAVGVALDEAKLRVTSLWPVLADPHMGHHSGAGNCEYDVVVVVRGVEQVAPAKAPASTGPWLRRLGALSPADQANLRNALRMATPRWGSPFGA